MTVYKEMTLPLLDGNRAKFGSGDLVLRKRQQKVEHVYHEHLLYRCVKAIQQYCEVTARLIQLLC